MVNSQQSEISDICRVDDPLQVFCFSVNCSIHSAHREQPLYPFSKTPEDSCIPGRQKKTEMRGWESTCCLGFSGKDLIHKENKGNVCGNTSNMSKTGKEMQFFQVPCRHPSQIITSHTLEDKQVKWWVNNSKSLKRSEYLHLLAWTVAHISSRDV